MVAENEEPEVSDELACHIHPKVFSDIFLKGIFGWIEDCVFDLPACGENA